jgi:Glycosyl transferase family 2
MQCDVSVILPVYWREATARAKDDLFRAIESVRDQRYPGSLEVLVVDDGSARPVADALADAPWGLDSRIRCVRLPRNAGLVNALNTGLAMARHGLVARIDGDDAWRPGKMEKQLALFDADPELTIVGTGMRLVHVGPGTDLDLVRPGDWLGILRFFGTEGCPFPHGSVVARRDVYRLLGGYPHAAALSHCEDYALWGTWLRFFKPAMLEEVLFDYSVSSTSVSGRHAQQQRAATQVVLRTFLELGDVRRLPDALRLLSEATGSTLLEAGRLAFKLWKHRVQALVPEAAVEPLRVLLPDRRVFATSAARAPTNQRRPAEQLVRLEVF